MNPSSFETTKYGSTRSLIVKLTLQSQDIVNNKSVVAYRIEGAGTNSTTWYRTKYIRLQLNGATTWESSGEDYVDLAYGTLVKSGTTTISHNSDGTKSIAVNLRGAIYSYGTYQSVSGTSKINTIPRASLVSASSNNIGANSSIAITRYSTAFTHKLYYKFSGESSYTLIASNVSTSYSWLIPTLAYALIPKANSISCTILCETYNGTTLIGSSTATLTASVVNSNPIFTEDKVTYKDNNNSVVDITKNNQLIVRNLSILNVIIASATAQNSASITGYELTFNGNTQIVQAGTINLNTINLAKEEKLTVTAIDSRGNKTPISKVITILDWVLPQAVISAQRVNNYEDNTVLNVNATISSVNNINSIQSIRYRYKKTTDSNYSGYTNIPNNTPVVFVINKLYAWNLQITITDKFGTTTYNLVVQKGIPIMFIDIDKLSVGVNKLPIHENSLEAEDIYSNGEKLSSFDIDKVYPIGSIYINNTNIDPKTVFGGTWLKITDKFILGAGGSYALGSTGGVANVTLATAQIPSHNHSFSGSAHTHYIEWSNGYRIALSTSGGSQTGYYTGYSSGKVSPTNMRTTSATTGGTVGNNGGGQAHENMPPYIAMNIWYRSA